jgi:cyclic dehypoxanthinyl futalosine synthase
MVAHQSLPAEGTYWNRILIATNNSLTVNRLLNKAADGRRLSVDEALHLAANASLADLGLAADARRNQLHPGRRVSYIVERNINYTNVCNVYCRFCAFYRAPGRPGGYTLSKEELAVKIDETVAAGGIQILLQGGLNPDCGIEYYEDLFRWLKQQYPTVNLHALSADEVLHVCKVSDLSIEEALTRLIAAGMGSLPGAGAEILVDHVRKRIARLKSGADKWLAVHRAAHRLGIPSTCTMMFGVKESWHDRILHFEMLRDLQDETGGFTAFITWPYQQGELKLGRGNTSAAEYLRVQALARLFLDNIPHLQSSWVTQGPSIGQVALSFGADDFGAVMFEENVVSAAGTTFRMNSEFIESQIRRAGYTPWRRNVRYQSAER